MDQLYTVYDEAAEAYLTPFFVPTLKLAIRAFTDCINSPDHQFGKHPHDYTLFYLGSYDPQTGEFDLGGRKTVGNGVSFISSTNDQPGLFDEPPSPINRDDKVRRDKTSGNTPL